MFRQGTQASGFRGALVFYPGCGNKALLGPTLKASSPIQLFLAADDEEVSPALCTAMADRSRQAGTRIDVVTYPGATHGFDEPSASRQRSPGNNAAMKDALSRAGPTVDGWLKE